MRIVGCSTCGKQLRIRSTTAVFRCPSCKSVGRPASLPGRNAEDDDSRATIDFDPGVEHEGEGASPSTEAVTLPPTNPPLEILTVAPEASSSDSPTVPPRGGGAEGEAVTLPPSRPSGTSVRRAERETPRIPGYEILGELGRGGMGVVYQARHEKLNRTVALKMILAGGHASDADVARFLSEAEAVAAFQHPNIVQVFEIGQHQGLPFMALEFVNGGSLGGKLKKGPLPATKAARMVEQIARGMNAAHQGGIVHRDLKPDNVLLGQDGTPKVTDFGLAKRVEGGSGLTHTGAVMGTPSYMAPEQANGEGKRVGPAADVYALGAILYCCLTGKPPFQAGSPLDTILQVVGEEPKPPSQLNPRVPKDLETICLKCLNKEPGKRYANAEALAEDLRRFLQDEPITARPVGRGERLVKWVKRNKAVAASLAAVFLALVLGAGISIWQALEAFSQRETARAEAKRANENEQQAKLNERKTLQALDRANQALYLSMLDQASFVYQTEPHKALGFLHDYRFCPIDRRCSIWHFYERQCSKWLEATLRGHGREVTCVAFSPDGSTLASASKDGTIRLWEAATGREKATLLGHTILAKGPWRYPSMVTAVSFSPDGKTLASAAGTNDLYGHVGLEQYGEIKLWDVKTGKVTATFEDKKGVVTSVSFSPDGNTLASIGRIEGSIKLWDVKTGKQKAALQGHAGTVSSVSFSPDGNTLASGGSGHDPKTRKNWTEIKLWDLSTGQEKATLSGHIGTVRSLSFSPDGKTLASTGGGFDAKKTHSDIRLWDVRSGVEKYVLESHRSFSNTVCFSPDGKTLASGGYVAGGGGEIDPGEIRLWDVGTGQAITSLRGHRGVSSVRFSPDGRTLASSGSDMTIKLWKIEFGQETATFEAHKTFSRSVTSLFFSPDGKTLASVNQGTIKLWDVTTRKAKPPLQRPANGVDSLGFSPDGKTLALADLTIGLWDVETGEQKATLKGHTNSVWSLSFSPDGSTLASSSRDNTIKLWNVKTGQTKATLGGLAGKAGPVCFSPDGTTLASVLGNQTIQLWDVGTGQEKASIPLKEQAGGVQSLKFSPDGKTLFSTSGKVNEYGEIRLWDVETGQFKAAFQGHKSTINAVSFSPDGKTLASASRGVNRLGGSPFPSEIKLWDIATGQEKAALTGHQGQVQEVSFSPDGRTLASAGGDTGPSADTIPGELILWDVTTGQAKATLRGHSSTVWSVRFSPDGRTLASTSADRTTKLWDLGPGRETAVLKGHSESVRSLSYSPDGRTLASGSSDSTIKLWDTATGRDIAALKGHAKSIFRVSFGPDGKILASASNDGTIKLWDVETGKARATFSGPKWGISSMCFSPDGKTLASGSSLDMIKLWDVATGEEKPTLKGRTTGTIDALVFSPDGNTLAAGMTGNTIRLWDVSTGQEKTTLQGRAPIKSLVPGSIKSLAFSPDGSTLVSGGTGNTIQMWDVSTGREKTARPGRAAGQITSTIYSLSFSPDGKTFASASGGTDLDTRLPWGEIKLWDVETGRETTSLNGFSHQVLSVRFSSDGKTLASAGQDGTVRLWNVAVLRAEAAADRER